MEIATDIYKRPGRRWIEGAYGEAMKRFFYENGAQGEGVYQGIYY